MTFQSYQEYFKAITTQELTIAPYDSEEYREYVKMNEVRQNRWLKKGIIQTAIRSRSKTNGSSSKRK